jgi:peptidylprolyl isomerase
LKTYGAPGEFSFFPTAPGNLPSAEPFSGFAKRGLRSAIAFLLFARNPHNKNLRDLVFFMKGFALLMVVGLLLLGCVSQPQATPTPSASQAPSASPTVEVSQMAAQKGDLVSVDYVGTLDDGTVFDTSLQAEAIKANLPLRPSYSPLEFTVGAGQMIQGFDSGVVGMKEGEEKTVKLEPAQAYGEWKQELVLEVPKSRFSENVTVGSVMQASNGALGKVIEVTNSTVKIDFNHELAGKALTFRIMMRKITRG